jgi:subtilisin family serine protease
MKKIFSILLALFLASCGSYQSASNPSAVASGSASEPAAQQVTAQSILSNMANGKYKEGELLVKFKSGAVHASSASHQSVGASVVKKLALMPEVELVRLPEGVSVSNAVVQYMSDPNVEYAEPNYIRHVYSVTPNDTYFVNLYGLHNTGHYAYGYDDADIDAPEAWSTTVGSQGVKIAVIDTGIDYNHSDLVGNLWTNSSETNCVDGIDNDLNGYIDDCLGWNFVGGNNDPMDDYGHGTHVAGTIGATGNNAEGVVGVMWRASIMPLKAFDADGIGYEADIVEAIGYAVGKGARIINASWGGTSYSAVMYDAINMANNAGVLFVAAAGNGDDDGVGDNNDLFPHYPASFDLPNIISVAATDQRDDRVPFSNYGPISVDIAAPGVYIWSTVPNWWSTYTGYGIIETFSGTSMAAPHVSGVAGLLFSYYDGLQNTQFTHSQIRSTILWYADTKQSLDGWIYTKARINAHRAVSSLLVPTGLIVTANPYEIPEEPSASVAASPGITLSWTDNATGEAGYKIERRSEAGFSEIAVVGPDTNTYTDSNLDPETGYAYRVRAYNHIADSFYSNEAGTVTLSEGEGVPHGGGGCSVTAGKSTGTVDLLIMLVPVAAILTLIKRRKS